MRLRIVSDGKVTTAVDDATGKAIENVVGVTFQHAFGEMPRLIVEFVDPAVELAGETLTDFPPIDGDTAWH